MFRWLDRSAVELRIALQMQASNSSLANGDVSIVGYNDAPPADHVDPPLTTIRLPGSELGRRVARLALDQLSDEPTEASTVQLPPELVVRRSTVAIGT